MIKVTGREDVKDENSKIIVLALASIDYSVSATALFIWADDNPPWRLSFLSACNPVAEQEVLFASLTPNPFFSV